MSNDKKSLMATNQKTVTGLLDKMKHEIARCLPKHLTPERMTRIALTELRKTPKLQECDPMSFVAAIMQASQLGLEPGILGSCYLIPFYNSKLGKYECTFMPGYRGFIDLSRRSGQIISLVARSVYANDEFSYEFGLDEKLVHKPCMTDKGQLIAVYAVAKLKDGGHQFDIMSRQEVESIRNQSKSKDSGPWLTHFDEMAKKTVLRKLFKWLPCSVEMQKAVSLDEQQEIGIQNIRASASEEFDMDFMGNDEVDNKLTKEEQLVDKLKSAKGKIIDSEAVSETGESINKEQLDKINSLLYFKGEEYLKESLSGYGVNSQSQLTKSQADIVISGLNKLPDKD